MTAYGSTTRNTDRPAETGWAKARRRRDGRVRSCLPATADKDTCRARTEPDWNIVRGED
ncbi:hypothetical protein [Streptomyces fructofermentans]|uniref:Uncharacterized protein n=1 Tax=Streptomyces fructofermentans TaxID=152141 RepID=A0A918NCF7_9ACTN|nr:hypothetical protein [Streptomyces fructofermentans]GGX57482.1 hypothetical protein GCM10010515_26340 [Streptomyces fructofermentans]